MGGDRGTSADGSAHDPDRYRPGFLEEAVPHLDAVYRFALRLTRSAPDAEDLVQETFLRAYGAWHQYTLGTKIKSWLFTICRNAFLRERERAARREGLTAETAPQASASADEREAATSPWATVADSDPEGEFFASIVDARILRAIDELPDDYRVAVVLSDIEGLSYHEIADLLQVPIGTVKSRLFRARRRLQEVLYAYAVEAGVVRAARGRKPAG